MPPDAQLLTPTLIQTLLNRPVRGPRVPFSTEIHTSKYREGSETFEDLISRLSRVETGLADNAGHAAALDDILGDMRFLPAGRVQASIGAIRRVTPYNCFVSGNIADSFVEGEGSIMQRASEAAQTMRMGGGIGYDFSDLRPRGDLIKKLGSQSSGPRSFMEIFNAVCKCVASSGHRRGAQMGVLRVDHPDIEEYVTAKTNSDQLTGFNLSIAATDEFMVAVVEGTPFSLRFQGEHRKWVDARELWNLIMQTTWDWAEPGILFIDRINEMNNLHYCERIVATNPCGEQPLPPFGACLLGSFNLTRYLTPTTHGAAAWSFNPGKLRADLPAVVRAMDNVVDRAIYPLERQELEARRKRRMGLGVTGLANAAEACGHPYGTEKFVRFTEEVLGLIRDEAYAASIALAAEKKPFPLFETIPYCNGRFIQKLPRELRQDLFIYGIRNSHLTSIAPTGTISLAADNVSSSIEPVFAHEFDRTYMTFAGERVETVRDYGLDVLGHRGRQADEVSPQEHVAVLCAASKLVDSAVSKTCNVGDGVGWEDFKGIYMSAWEGGAKGCTTFRAAGKRFGVLNAKPAKPTEAEYEEMRGQSCSIDPLSGRRDCS